MKFEKLNPFNSLFGRVFVWFWFALLVILLSAFFITKQLSNVVEVSAAEAGQIDSGTLVVEKLARLLDKGGRFSQSLRRAGDRRGNIQIVAINRADKDIRFNFPAPLAGNITELKGFIDAEYPVLIKLNNMQFVGPYPITHNDKNYQIFVGRLLKREERSGMSRSRAAIAGLSLAIVLSTLFCFALVLSMTKPISALRKASKRLADGELSYRIEGLESRHDEIGQLADDFNSMASQLQSVVENQKQLMANVSHELRTPLTRLQLATALLEDQEVDEKSRSIEQENKAKQLHRIQTDIDKMDKLIGQVLTIAKLNATERTIHLATHSLTHLLSGVFNDGKFEAEANGKELVVNQIPTLSGQFDANLIVSAIENIIRNGLRFAEKTVHCEIQVDSEKNTSSSLRITISDDGQGMKAEQINQVFDPFFRGENQVSENNKGAGLGLSIAKAAVEAHHGTISAKESPFGGLSVIIQIPIAE